jgi:hypothetical protein
MPINVHIIQVILRKSLNSIVLYQNVFYLEKSLSDFELVPNQRLQVKPKSVLIGVSVESCSERLDIDIF